MRPERPGPVSGMALAVALLLTAPSMSGADEGRVAPALPEETAVPERDRALPGPAGSAAPAADELEFAEGWEALEAGDWEAAASRFREVLQQNPELTRVRLDLALALFKGRRDMAAAYHFRQALGDPGMPEEVRRKVLFFLERIERRREWSFTAEAGVSRDSNIGSATDADRVDLFGFPAELSDESRPKSGAGLTLALSGDRRWVLDADTRLVASAGLTTRTYSESRFNERSLRVGVGPRFLFGRNRIGMAATISGRRVGGKPHDRAAGLEISGSLVAGPAWKAGVRAGMERILYEALPTDSTVVGIRAEATHVAGPATQVHLSAGVREERADESRARSWREHHGGVTVVREIAGGYGVGGSVFVGDRRYGAPVRILGPDARRDRRVALVLSVSNGRFGFAGFVPRLSVIHEWRRSNLRLHEYRRTVVEAGLARRF